MNKVQKMFDRETFWKVHDYIESLGDDFFLRWFEAMAFAYAWKPAIFDEFAEAFKFYYKED